MDWYSLWNHKLGRCNSIQRFGQFRGTLDLQVYMANQVAGDCEGVILHEMKRLRMSLILGDNFI